MLFFFFFYSILLTDTKITTQRWICLKFVLLQIFSVLEHIAEKEGIEMPQDVALAIAKDSTYNLPRAIRLFESSSLAK